MRSISRWAASDFRRGLAGLDPAKLMVAPILYVAMLALIDRAYYELRLQVVPGTTERGTRL